MSETSRGPEIHYCDFCNEAKSEFAGVLGADQSDAAFTEHHAVKTNVSAECVERIQQKLASICDSCLPIVP